MTTYTARLCAAGDACRAFDRLTELPEDAARHTLGDACLRAAELATRALPADWRDLEQLLPPALGVWGDGQPRGHNAPPIPLNAGVEAVQAAIWWVCTTWEDVAREMHHLAEPARRRPGQIEHPSARPRSLRPGPADVVRAVGILAPRLGPLSDVDGVTLQDYPLAGDEQAQTVRPGWQGVLDLLALHQWAVSALGLTAPVRRLPGWCAACGWQETLRQEPPRWAGDEQPVVCSQCAAVTTYEDYGKQMGAWAV